jgi:hypothetical protein
VVAASTDREEGVTTGVTTPAETETVFASIRRNWHRHLHHDTSCE